MREYVGDMSTLCGAERLIVAEGKGKGTELIRVYNGKLDFYLNVDRGLDIYRLSYMGENVSYITKNGLVSPALVGTEGMGFREGFDGGFLYTCGLDNVGVPATVDGKELVMHGSLSYIPAENVCVKCGFEGSEYVVEVSGKMRTTGLFGSCLVMERKVRVTLGGDSVEVDDSITNENYTDDKYMIQYHTNFGYPFLDENTRLWIDATGSEGVPPAVEKSDTKGCFEFEKPQPGIGERCYFHYLKDTGKGVHASVSGHGATVDLEFDTAEEPYILEWKYPSCGDYVLGVEPTTTRAGKKDFIKIKPAETKHHRVRYIFKKN